MEDTINKVIQKRLLKVMADMHNLNEKKKIPSDFCESCHLFKKSVKAGKIYYYNYQTHNYDEVPYYLKMKQQRNQNIYCRCQKVKLFCISFDIH